MSEQVGDHNGHRWRLYCYKDRWLRSCSRESWGLPGCLRSATANSTTVYLSMDFFVGLRWFALQGQALAAAAAEVYVKERTSSILGEVESYRKIVHEAVSFRFIEMSSKLHELATPVLMVLFSDSQISIYGITSCCSSSSRGLRAHKGTQYVYSKGAWNPCSGLISDSILGRTNTFLLHLEGLSAQFSGRRLARTRHPAHRIALESRPAELHRGRLPHESL